MKHLTNYISEKLKITKNDLIKSSEDNSFESFLYKLSEILFDNKYDITNDKDLNNLIENLFNDEYFFDWEYENKNKYHLRYPQEDFIEVDEFVYFFKQLVEHNAIYKITKDPSSKERQWLNIYINENLVFSIRCDFKDKLNKFI